MLILSRIELIDNTSYQLVMKKV